MTGPVDDKADLRSRLDLANADWRSTAPCGQTDEPHLEHAFVQGYVAVRTSERQEPSRTLIFTTAEWEAFVRGVQHGEFDTF